MDLLAVLPNAESASVPVANAPVGASAPAQAEVDAPNDEAGQISDEACIISATDTGGDASNQGGARRLCSAMEACRCDLLLLQ